MRRAHDPSAFRGRWLRCGRKPQQQRGDAGGLRGQGQLAAGDEIELPRLAPDFQHDRAERIAGERIGRGAQRALDVEGTHRHERARIEAKLAKPMHRQRTGFDLAKILPHPNQRPPRRHAPGQPCNESGRGCAVPAAFGKNLMQHTPREPALQRRIGFAMAKRDPVWRRGAMRLDALDVLAQDRKRASGADLTFATPLTVIS
jgi:hypothetical protein